MVRICTLVAFFVVFLNINNVECVKTSKTRRGICSWYGADGEIPPGWPTSCGQPFDRMAMKAATWPEVRCNATIRVTNLDNKKSIIVQVDDRFGGAPKDRIVDLTYGAFAKLAPRAQGLIKNCQYEIIG